MSCNDYIYWLPQLLDYDFQIENEYSFEWRKYLLNKNLEEIAECALKKERFTFYTPAIVKCVFSLCQMLKQPPEVRYLAIDIFDRFLGYHFFDVSETFQKMDNQSLENWRMITERMLSQSTLRILTSIQLAVKFCWSYNIITTKTIQEVLELLGNSTQYSKKSILKSEARIYKNLNYNIPSVTPLTYIEMFFDQFRPPGVIQLNVPLNTFFLASIHALDIAIVYHQQVYLNAVEVLNNSIEKNLNENYTDATLKGDFVMLAASVIFASSVLTDPQMETSEAILEILCTIGQCRKFVVHVLGKNLLKIIQNYI